MKPSCRTSKISSGETNIVGFAPMLGGEASVEETSADSGHFLPVSQWIFLMKRDMRQGEKTVSPYWQVTGDWPQEPTGAGAADLSRARAGAAQMGWKPGDKLTLRTEGEAVQVTVSGILSGGDEDNQLVMPLSTVQHLLGLPGKVQAIRVSRR